MSQERQPPSKPCRRCVDCRGEEHHYSIEIVEFADNEPDHPAAQAGHQMWMVCKHCEAWKPITDKELDDG